MNTYRLLRGMVLGALLAALTGLGAANAGAEEQRMGGAPSPHKCRDCHTCEKPTAPRQCLTAGLREWARQKAAAGLSSGEVSKIIRLDILENLYDPVHFDHLLHAKMAEMNVGCVACHHNTPTGLSHPRCKECHGIAANDGRTEMPGLKGAYHRQCMDCHRAWSGKDDCEICHALKAPGEKREPVYTAGAYRQCREPARKTYRTGNTEVPFVTFFHDNHARHYGLSCSECHRKDACVACHYKGEKPLAVVQSTADAMHHKCSACHDIQSESSCTECHAKRVRTVFSHRTATGWDTSPYHGMIACASCHPAGRRITGPDGTCNSCHESWNEETFAHAVVGLALDEEHVEQECADCHMGRRFEEPPTCEECHDEKKYPRDKPGKTVQPPNGQKR